MHLSTQELLKLQRAFSGNIPLWSLWQQRRAVRKLAEHWEQAETMPILADCVGHSDSVIASTAQEALRRAIGKLAQTWGQPATISKLTDLTRHRNSAVTTIAQEALDALWLVCLNVDITRSVVLLARLFHAQWQPSGKAALGLFQRIQQMPVAIFELARSARASSMARGLAVLKKAVHHSRSAAIFTLEHDKDVTLAIFSPCSSRVLTTSGNVVRLWDAMTGQPVGSSMEHEWAVRHAAFNPDGDRIVTACGYRDSQRGEAGGYGAIWDARTGSLITRGLDHSGLVNYAEFSPDGKRVVTASWDNTARVWCAMTGQAITPCMEHVPREWQNDWGQRIQGSAWVWQAAFSPDGRRVATASDDFSARIWDASTGKAETPPMQHKCEVVRAAFSPDGGMLATVCGSHGQDPSFVRVWNATTGFGRIAFKHDGPIFSIEWSPDCDYLLTASSDGTARLWDVRSEFQFGNTMRHKGSIRHAEFNRNGRLIATASSDNTVRIWDSATQQQIGDEFKHPSHYEGVQYVTFSPNGQRIATASDKEVYLWGVGLTFFDQLCISDASNDDLILLDAYIKAAAKPESKAIATIMRELIAYRLASLDVPATAP